MADYQSQIQAHARERAGELALVAKLLLEATATGRTVNSIVDERRVSPGVKAFLTKAGVGAGTTTDPDFGSVLVDQVQAISKTFLATLRNRSIYFRGLDSGFLLAPLRVRLGVTTAVATAWLVGEGKAVPISRLTMKNDILSPHKVCALTIVSDEVAASQSPGAQNLVTTELRGAISDTVDKEFLDLVVDGSTPVLAGGVKMQTDLAALLAAVNTSGAGYLFFAMSADVANRAALSDITHAMTPTGGEIVGLPAMVSRMIPAGTLYLINAAAIAANAGAVELSASQEADIEMSDAPVADAGVPTPAASLVSMWQTNAVALRAVIEFAAERLLPNAVAKMTDIAWTS